MKLKIKNFQSIEDCEIVIPERSFTCLVGSTNIGKSAIRRSLECLLYNKSEISYIRNGSKSCEVQLSLEDGNIIKWWRDKKTSYYEVNGESYSKLSGSVPDIILNKGFNELSINKEKLSVQIASQFENIFLLNKTGSYITEVLSNLGNLNKIIEANKQCLSDKKNIKNKIKVREEDLSSLNKNVLVFENLNNQNNLIIKLKELLNTCDDLRSKKEEALKLNIKLDRSNSRLKYLKDLSKVKNIDESLNFENLDNIKKIFNKYQKSNLLISYYEKIPKKDMDCSSILELFEKYKKIKELEYKYNNSHKKYINYKNNPEEIKNLNFDSNKILNLSKIYSKLSETKNNILKYRKDIIEGEDKSTQLVKEYTCLKEELKICPICDSSLI